MTFNKKALAATAACLTSIAIATGAEVAQARPPCPRGEHPQLSNIRDGTHVITFICVPDGKP
jgi:hypothetical protein